MADVLLALPTPLLREWFVPIGRGRAVGEQMATPSFQCLSRWLPPPPYLCHAQDIRGTSTCYWGFQAWGARHLLSFQGCPGEMFYPG